MKKIGKYFIFFCILTIALITTVGCNKSSNSNSSKMKTDYTNYKIPTIFLHGSDSSYKAEEDMVNFSKKRNAIDNVTKADVNPHGKVTLSGNIPKDAFNPVIEINFEDSNNNNYYTNGQWLKNVMFALQHKYHFKKFNAVAHSKGNLVLVYYLLKYGQDDKLPQLQKQVDLAGNFDGTIGTTQPKHLKVNKKTGKPNKMIKRYKALLPLRKTYPKQIKIINMMGYYDDENNDGTVSNASSHSLKYLVNKRTKLYIEKTIIGDGAEHSRLHENNQQVDYYLTRFLWSKDKDK